MIKPILFALLFTVTTTAHANDEQLSNAPEKETLVNNATSSNIEYKCTNTPEGKLLCEFSQIFSLNEHKPENDKRALEHGRNEHKNLTDEDKDIIKKSCNDIKLYEQFFDKKISKQEFISKLSEHNTLKESDFAEMNETTNREFLDNHKDLTNYCANPNEENYLRLIGLAPKENSITCSSYVNRFSQTFKFVQNGANNKGAWVSESDKAGECNNVRTSKFEIDEDNSWNFTVKNAITEKKYTRNRSECPAADNNEYVYNLKDKQKQKDGICHYMEFDGEAMVLTSDGGGTQVNKNSVLAITPHGETIPLD